MLQNNVRFYPGLPHMVTTRTASCTTSSIFYTWAVHYHRSTKSFFPLAFHQRYIALWPLFSWPVWYFVHIVLFICTHPNTYTGQNTTFLFTFISGSPRVSFSLCTQQCCAPLSSYWAIDGDYIGWGGGVGRLTEDSAPNRQELFDYLRLHCQIPVTSHLFRGNWITGSAPP